MAHVINWFEIPAKNFQRAKTFYETLLGVQLADSPGMNYAMFPADLEKGEVSGALIEDLNHQPVSAGPLIYLNGGDDLGVPLSRVEAAGGNILLPKTSIGPHGFMAHFTDTEGNRVALHSQN